MATCEVCGNDYHLSFDVVMAGKTHTFDSFECAIHALAPICAHCGCRVIGHGVEEKAAFYCCMHCAKHAARPGTEPAAASRPQGTQHVPTDAQAEGRFGR